MKIRLLALLTLLSMLLSLVSCDVISGFMSSEDSGTGDTARLPGEENTPEPEPEHEHVWRIANCIKPERCDCGETRGEPLGHNMTEATCTEYAVCITKGCGYVDDQLDHHTVRYVHNDEGKSCLVCAVCEAGLDLDTDYYLDGTHYDGMVGVVNKNGYTVKEGTDLPVLTENGEYQLLNVTGINEQMQLWVPSNKAVVNGFTSTNNAVGVFAFRLNANVADSSSMKFADTNSTATRWSKEWCITDHFFSLSGLYVKDGKVKVSVKGFDSVILKEVEVEADDGFTGWIDVLIGIELDAETDTVILHYYINGEYCGTLSKPLTTETNGINSVYINFHSAKVGMGAYFDDIVFGYATDAEWIYN